MKIAVGIAALAAAGLALAGCTNSDDDASTAPSPTQTTVAEGQTSSPVPSVGNLDDPLCAAAQDSVSVATTLESTAGDLQAMLQDPTFLTSEDVSELNGWGEDMLALSNETLKFYEIGVDETEGEDVNADFAALKGFVSEYTLARLGPRFEVEELPPAHLKGKEKPLRIFNVKREKASAVAKVG